MNVRSQIQSRHRGTRSSMVQRCKVASRDGYVVDGNQAFLLEGCCGTSPMGRRWIVNRSLTECKGGRSEKAVASIRLRL